MYFEDECKKLEQTYECRNHPELGQFYNEAACRACDSLKEYTQNPYGEIPNITVEDDGFHFPELEAYDDLEVRLAIDLLKGLLDDKLLRCYEERLHDEFMSLKE